MGRSIPKVLDDSGVDALVEVFNTRYDSGLKNRCMVRLMLECGLRVSEICDLKRGDVDLMACQLVVREGKGGKDRQLWFPDDLQGLLGEWLERRPETEAGWMFPTRERQSDESEEHPPYREDLRRKGGYLLGRRCFAAYASAHLRDAPAQTDG
jgi:integrase